MATTQQLANSIATMEGFNTSGTIAQRNNNPGNLRYAANQVGTENTVNGTFATFATPQDGWDALTNYINNNSGMTLRDFIYKYAPPSENNSSSYLSYISGQLGIGVEETLGSVLNGSSGVSQDWVDTTGSSLNVSDYLSNIGAGLDSTTLIALA